MNDQRKLEIANEALLKHADQLEQSVAYWKSETDKAWEAAKRWREEEAAKAADVRDNMDTLCQQIEALGALIPVSTGGTPMRRHSRRSLKTAHAMKHKCPMGVSPFSA